MINEKVTKHLSSVGVNTKNLSEDKLDGYFSAAKDSEFAYLPDPAILPLERAVDALNRVAIDSPDLPVALSPFEQEHGNFTVASFDWDGKVRFDLLFPFSLSQENTVWGTARSVAAVVNTFFRGGTATDRVKIEGAEAPFWAQHGFLLLFALPPEGFSINDVGEVTNFDAYQNEVQGGELQRAASSVHGHHILSSLDLNEDEEKALFEALGATFENKIVGISTLIAIGALNPFSSEENLVLRSTVAGTIVMGSSVVVSPIFILTPAQEQE